MTAIPDEGDSAAAAHRKWSRARVIAAAGLVLGLGSLATVATYQDNTWAAGQLLSAVRGGIEGSTNSTNGTDGTWSSHFTSATAATMVVNPSTNLVPGGTTYSRFAMRTNSGVTSTASVTMGQGVVSKNGTTTDTMVNAVRVRAFTSTNHTCNSTTVSQTGGVTYLLGTSGTYATAGGAVNANTVTLPAGTTTTAGTGRTICFEFSLTNTATSDAANGADFTVTWPFTTTLGT
ncbi:hypothetical protein NGF75_07275 [Dietzia kunjamensis]|uniref:hypothetical protein n=1 Tax=Dietzia kunjamensis TaxID=322509 RepID=UPI002DBA210D|nr:hypothetical protein [Dietzia kunjamensis]MEB8325787.1 hypothetical protein [Dietzia kunjamensis]